MVSGASVAGIQAGKVFNTWPLMNGSFVPSDYWRPSLEWRNFFENKSAVQFNHRLFAYNTLFFVLLGFARFTCLHKLAPYVGNPLVLIPAKKSPDHGPPRDPFPTHERHRDAFG